MHPSVRPQGCTVTSDRWRVRAPAYARIRVRLLTTAAQTAVTIHSNLSFEFGHVAAREERTPVAIRPRLGLIWTDHLHAGKPTRELHHSPNVVCPLIGVHSFPRQAQVKRAPE